MFQYGMFLVVVAGVSAQYEDIVPSYASPPAAGYGQPAAGYGLYAPPDNVVTSTVTLTIGGGFHTIDTIKIIPTTVTNEAMVVTTIWTFKTNTDYVGATCTITVKKIEPSVYTKTEVSTYVKGCIDTFTIFKCDTHTAYRFRTITHYSQNLITRTQTTTLEVTETYDRYLQKTEIITVPVTKTITLTETDYHHVLPGGYGAPPPAGGYGPTTPSPVGYGPTTPVY